MRDDFAVFILTHGRADNVVTYETLKRCGYTGRIYIVIDNEDGSAEDYFERFGEQVVVFDKSAVAKTFDTGDNNTNRNTVVYARNASFDIATALGLTYFLELDDDYSSFQWRFIEGKKLRVIECRQLDRLFDSVLDFLDASGAVTVTLAQGGDFIGGKENQIVKKGLTRKAMNTFFCRTDRRFDFVGRINEDVNTYVTNGGRGNLFFMLTNVMITQERTQKNEGGMTEVYIDSGTYLKSFFTVMYAPSCVTISPMGSHNQRIHHRVAWNNAVPKILDEGCRRGRD